MKNATRMLAVVGAAAAASAASATTYSFDWNAGDTPVNNAGGQFESIRSSYNDATQKFTWELAFADQVTDGFTLAVSPGPNPKGHAGELALVYFDAQNTAAPVVTVYAYNGENAQTSWADGSPLPGTQGPDKIASSIGLGAASILSAVVSDAGGGRTFSFEIDAAAINAHSPRWPGPGGDAEWTGLEYGPSIGLWLHPVVGLSADYGTDGFLNTWYIQGQGWLDEQNLTTRVPAPAGTAMLGLAGLACCRRRR